MRIGLFGRQLAILRCLARIFCNVNRHVDHWRTAKDAHWACGDRIERRAADDTLNEPTIKGSGNNASSIQSV